MSAFVRDVSFVKIGVMVHLVVIRYSDEFGSIKLDMHILQMAINLSYSNDLFIVNALLNMYSEIRSLELPCLICNKRC